MRWWGSARQGEQRGQICIVHHVLVAVAIHLVCQNSLLANTFHDAELLDASVDFCRERQSALRHRLKPQRAGLGGTGRRAWVREYGGGAAAAAAAQEAKVVL